MRQYCTDNFPTVLDNQTVDDSLMELHKVLIEGMLRFIPQKQIKSNSRQKPLWFTEEVRNKIKKKRRAHKKLGQARTTENQKAYARARNQAKWECEKARSAFEKGIAAEAKENPRAIYKYINTRLKTRSTIPDLIKEDGSLTANDTEKTQTLNKFFCQVFTQENDNPPDLTPELLPGITEHEPLTFTVELIEKKLRKLDANKAAGPDGLHPRVLKELASVLASPLSQIMQKSLDSHTTPKQWKLAHISPIFKKGDKQLPSNYRPVSLTCILCKLMEAVIRDSVMDHLEENNLLSQHQHGFVRKRSCATQLLQCLDEWTKAVDDGDQTHIIYLDFSKAFDSVPHKRLIMKMRQYGIQSDILQWCKSFLTNRQQKVVVNGQHSQWASVMSGVPQGSVLGPLMFVIFINDLPDVVESCVKLFADDVKLFRRTRTTEDKDKLQTDLDNLEDWADKWKMRFNPQKCQVLKLGQQPEPTPITYKLSGHDLETVTSIRDLGVQVNSRLNFHEHISQQVIKANRILGMVRQSFRHLDHPTFTKLYTGLVRPHLEYCHHIVQIQHEQDWKLIESVQRRATKLLAGLRELPYEERLAKLRLPSMHYRLRRGDMIEVYKYLNGLINAPLPFERDLSDRTRGHQWKLKKPTCRTSLRLNFFSYRIINDWNNLPEYVTEAPSINAFKSRLDLLRADTMFTLRNSRA